jgi:hypothetical protein
VVVGAVVAAAAGAVAAAMVVAVAAVAEAVAAAMAAAGIAAVNLAPTLAFHLMKEDGNMLKSASVVLSLVLLLGAIAPLYAADTQVEPKFTVLSTKFVDTVEGVNDKGEKDFWKVKDPKAGLILVMLVKVEAGADTKFLTSDFSARYEEKGDPAMADCIAITPGTPSQETQGRWLIGNCGDKVCKASEEMKKGTVYFQMAFEPIDPGVKLVNLNYARPVVKQIKIR